MKEELFLVGAVPGWAARQRFALWNACCRLAFFIDQVAQQKIVSPAKARKQSFLTVRKKRFFAIVRHGLSFREWRPVSAAIICSGLWLLRALAAPVSSTSRNNGLKTSAGPVGFSSRCIRLLSSIILNKIW